MGTSGPMQLAQVLRAGHLDLVWDFIIFVSLWHNVPQPCLVAGVGWRKEPDLVGV